MLQLKILNTYFNQVLLKIKSVSILEFTLIKRATLTTDKLIVVLFICFKIKFKDVYIKNI